MNDVTPIGPRCGPPADLGAHARDLAATIAAAAVLLGAPPAVFL